MNQLEVDKFENQISPHTVWLVRRLIRTDQAKPGLIIFIEKVLDVPREEALRFFKKYKEYVNAQPATT